jgi:glycolate oxidase FAD binding subunit
MTTFQPSDGRETAEIVAWAAAEGRSLELVAGGAMRAFGRPVKTEHVLDLRRLAGVVAYEPAELVLTARPAAPLKTVIAELAAAGQMLAFEPPDWRPLLGGEGEPTLGGAIACGLAGPRRVRAGSARDYLLGFAAVNGFGEVWKAGGKVVKNVTGYDMMKLQAGAFGTLSALTEVTLKASPKPETATTLALAGLDDEAAIRLLARALNSPFEVSGAAHLPAAAARRSSVAALSEGQGGATLLRLEGPLVSVAYRTEALEALLGRGARLTEAQSEIAWKEVAEVRPLLVPGSRVVWRACPTPSRAVEVARTCIQALPSAEVFFDWGGGLVWLSLDGSDAGADAGAAVIRGAVGRAGGHATLVVASEAQRAFVPVFEPAPGPLARLGAGVKAAFDPRNILNPGRMHGEA